MKKVVKYLGTFKKIVDEYLLKGIPLASLFDNYDLSEDQIAYIYKRVEEVYGDNKIDEELNTFYIPKKDRKLNGLNLNFLFQKLESAIQSCSEAEIQNIKEEIIIRNINLVKDSVNFLFNKIALPKEDAMMYGVNGLLDAINSYNVKSTISFASYALPKIVASIENNFKTLCGITWEEFIKGKNIPFIPVSMLPVEESSITIDDSIIPTTFTEYEETDELEDNELKQDDSKIPTTFADYEEIDELEDNELKQFGTETFDYDIKELQETFKQIFMLLKPKEAEALKQYFGFDNYESMTYLQIANQNKVSITTAKNRIQYGLRAIQSLPKKYQKKLIEFCAQAKWKSSDEYKRLQLQKEEEKSIKYMRIYDLLIHSISAEAFPSFMQMAGFKMTPDEIVEIVEDLKKLDKIAAQEGYNWLATCQRLEKSSEYSDISTKLIKQICQKYNIFPMCARVFNDTMYKMYREDLTPEGADKLIKTAKRML